MTKALFLTALLLVVALPAVAGGVHLAWGTDCYAANPVTNESFACNTNEGHHTLWVSFSPDYDQPEFSGIELCLVGVVPDPPDAVPDWWKMDTGECRAGAIVMNADFTSAPRVSCVDPWDGMGGGGLGRYLEGDAGMEVGLVYALVDPVPLTAGVEYYACKVIFSNVRTVGASTCAGCSTPVAWDVKYLRSFEQAQYQELHSVSQDPACACGYDVGWGVVSWQGCPLPVTARNTTWGQIKGQYR